MQHPQQGDADFVGHEPCQSCGSSDALARYSDGHGFCFRCRAYEKGNEEPAPAKPKRGNVSLIDVEIVALPKRGITEETCAKWGYGTGKDLAGTPVQVATYRNEAGQPIAQKLRTADKKFKFIGEPKDVGLYGQWLWRDGGKMVIVTEGEIDALTVSQLQGNRWPVVSVPNGAQGAAKAVKKSLDWLEQFDAVVFMFDMDEPGREAAQECAQLLSPGKAKVASLPLKDANDCLKAGKGKEVIDAIWGAKTYRPDGIIAGTDLWDAVTTSNNVMSIPYPWDGLNAVLLGMRRGELTTVTAGSGVGKSAVVRELAHHLLKSDETVGMMMLEEDCRRTALGMMGIAMNSPIHLDLTPYSELTEDQRNARKAAFDATVGSGRLFLYDHFGSTEIENLIARIRYLARGCDCGWIILDHLSIVVSGLEDGDERRNIDIAMTKLRTLVQELNIGMLLVSHLRRPQGDKGHEQGAQTGLSQLRGSHSIAQLSDAVIGLERDQQDDANSDVTTMRVLKNRFSGQTGVATWLRYDRETGRLSETDEPKDADEETKSPESGDF